MTVLIWMYAAALFPALLVYHLALTAVGALVVAAFFVAIFRFAVWGMRGRRY